MDTGKYKTYIYKHIDKLISLKEVEQGVYKTNCLCNKNHVAYYNRVSNQIFCPVCNENKDFLDHSAEIMNISSEELIYSILKNKFKIENNAMKDLVEEIKAVNEKKKRYYELNEKVMLFFEEEFKKSTQAQKYVYKDRQLSEDTVKKFHIGFAPKGNKLLKTFAKDYTVEELKEMGFLGFNKDQEEYYDMFSNRLMFPIWDSQNKVIAFGGRTLANAKSKYLNSPTTLIFSKYTCLYGINFLAKTEKYPYVLCCEGYMDLVMLHQHGIKNVVADLGVAITKSHLRTLDKYTNTKIAMLDGDSAGIGAMDRTIFEVGEIFTLTLPEKLDPDEYIKAYSKEMLLDYIKRNTLNWEQSIVESLKTKPGNMFENLLSSKHF